MLAELARSLALIGVAHAAARLGCRHGLAEEAPINSNGGVRWDLAWRESLDPSMQGMGSSIWCSGTGAMADRGCRAGQLTRLWKRVLDMRARRGASCWLEEEGAAGSGATRRSSRSCSSRVRGPGGATGAHAREVTQTRFAAGARMRPAGATGLCYCTSWRWRPRSTREMEGLDWPAQNCGRWTESACWL